jgi:hypothetical protein
MRLKVRPRRNPMDANFSNITHFEVDNFDDETYYGEMQGWRAEVEENEERWEIEEPRSEVKFCDHPQHRKARQNAEGLAGISLEDAPC